VVLRGEINWHIEGESSPINAKAGDFVLCPKLRNHHLEPVGSAPSVRIAINTRGEFHRYDRPGCRQDLWHSGAS
jgi:quercetin dioxygenase-like cupin family protein